MKKNDFAKNLQVLKNLENFKAIQLHSGFTLIELMVVVSIIGILMAAGILAFSNAQKSARDAKRRADVDAISKALEQYNQTNNGKYPPATAGTIDPTTIQSYFPSGTVPKDPTNSGSYIYTITGTASTPNMAYCVGTKLEKPGTGNCSTLGATGVCNYTGTLDFICTSQRQ